MSVVAEVGLSALPVPDAVLVCTMSLPGTNLNLTQKTLFIPRYQLYYYVKFPNDKSMKRQTKIWLILLKHHLFCHKTASLGLSFEVSAPPVTACPAAVLNIDAREEKFAAPIHS